MTKVDFVDQTIRDAQQSLWGLMMRTDHIIPIAEKMDRIGYRAIATVGSQAFTIQVRKHGEDPWDRIRSLRKHISRTSLRGSYQTASLSSFDLSTPRSIIALWIKRSVANGIRSFWICDYQENMERFRYFAKIARSEGAEVVTAIMYTASPVHTSEHWAQKACMIEDARECIDRVMIEDASGVITPENTRLLIETVRHNCTLPLEFHAHCNSGLAPLCYLEALKAGVTTLHTAVLPLANGTSLPSIESVLKNARHMGFSFDIDEDALAAVSAHFRAIAERENLPVGVPFEYDLFQSEHQVPGGMMTNLTRQLREIKMDHRLGEILNEVIHVRKEFGYPVMATPFSQIVGVQALENVISGERYKKITDEVIKYALGYYGKPVVPLDPNVMDRIMSLPRTKELLDWRPDGFLKSVEQLRQEIGPELSDDDLLLRILIPGKAARRKEPARGTGTPIVKDEMSPDSAQDISRRYPRRFEVDVDGDIFRVTISPVLDGTREITVTPDKEIEKIANPIQGAVMCGMAGLVLSIDVKVGEQVHKGHPLAMIEAMKMRRQICAPEDGVVREIRAVEGEIVRSTDILMVFA